MPEKRGRPFSHTEDAAVSRRRELTAARTRVYRQRLNGVPRARAQPTPAQLQQGERIVELGFTELDAAETLAQLGLRTRGLTLAQDPDNAQLQLGAVAVNEHQALYGNHNFDATQPPPPRAPPPPPPAAAATTAVIHDRPLRVAPPSSTRPPSGQSQLTQFFAPRAQGNPPISARPIVTPSPVQQSPITPSFSSLSSRLPPSSSSHRSPATPSFSSISAPPSETPPGYQGSEDTIFGENHPDHGSDDDGSVEIPESDQEDNHPQQNTDDEEDVEIPESDHDDNDTETSDKVTLEDDGDDDTGGVGLLSDDPTSPHTDNGEEDSVYNFQSERSVPSSDEESEPPIFDLQHTVDKLLAFFQGDVGACTDEQHDEQRRQHTATVADDDHYSLNEVFRNPAMIPVLSSPDMVTPARLRHYVPPNAAQLQSLFCGISPDNPQPRHVCLHKEESQAQPSRQAFDVDSYLGFLHSLAACRDGLWHQPVPQARQNMTTDVHLQTPTFVTGEDPEQPPQVTPAMLRDVPHFLLGRVASAHDITIHVLFPYLPVRQERFIALTKEQLSRWLDQVFYPAIYRHCEAHVTQHLPASFRHAYSNSKARQVEGRKVETASYQAQQSIGYHLQAEYLEPVWTDILHTIDTTPDLNDYREPQLFFSAKGSKLQFKTSPSRPSLLNAMEHFDSYLHDVFRDEFVDWERTYIDLASEICPGVGHLATDHLHVDEEPQVLSWKRCCQENIIRGLYDNEPPAKHSQGQRFYEQNMLYDATTVTSVPPKRSRLYGGGVRYLQLYGSVKEVWDAAKSKPFDNDGLEEMALDPQIRQAARHLAGGHRRHAVVIERAYCASKCRAHEALRDSRQKSFGIRAEFRISWSLFRALMDCLRLEVPDGLQIEHEDAPNYTWTVKTAVYLDFLWRSANKFASLFETVRARCREELVTWEQTKMMAMALRCLRFVLGGHQLSRDSALWWSRRERQVGDPPQLRIWYGLGFCNTLAQYGYCWLEPRIDWEQLVFKSAVTDRGLFGNSILRGQYLRRGGQMEDFFHLTRRLELALEWLARHHLREAIRDQLIFWTVHICLQQFRVDVLSSIKSDVQEEHRTEVLRGLVPFCFDYFQEMMVEDVYLISGNRCDFKQPSHLGHYLFDFDDNRVRAHWEHRPFRKLYRRARTALSLLPREQRLEQMFTRRFWRCLYAYHWVLPYPCAEVLTQTTKQGQRMMYSIQLEDHNIRRIEWAEPEQWRWERKSWRLGHPPPIPAYLSWSRAEWDNWIERHRHVEGIE